jgi:hypothetical protein
MNAADSGQMQAGGDQRLACFDFAADIFTDTSLGAAGMSASHIIRMTG